MSEDTQTAYAPLLTVDETADYLRVSRRQVYNLLETGAIPAVLLTGALFAAIYNKM